jgi:cytochrome b6-f complex iron-sulfur subunit
MRERPALPTNLPPLSCQPRRAFLTRLGVIAGAAALSPGLAGCETVEMHSDPPKKGATLSFDLADAAFKDLAAVGASVSIDVDGNKGLLIRSSTDKFIAMSSVCTHQGCPLSWDSANKAIKCFCHGAAFSADGKVTNKPSDGSAIAHLAVWSVSFDASSGKGTVTT